MFAFQEKLFVITRKRVECSVQLKKERSRVHNFASPVVVGAIEPYYVYGNSTATKNFLVFVFF